MAQKKTYKKLYLTILRIGQEKVHEGVSFNELKVELIKRGYDFDNNCIELSVRQWFYESFHHTGADENPYSTVRDLDNHLGCRFILKGESCLKLLGYETSRNSWRNGIIAITLSLFAISNAIYTNLHKSPKSGINESNNTIHGSEIKKPINNDTTKTNTAIPIKLPDSGKSNLKPK